MKTTILTLFLSTFLSCTRCADCVRTWTIVTKGGGVPSSTSTYTDEFERCGLEDIQEAEKGVPKTTTIKMGGVTIDSSATCSCVDN